MKGEYFLLPSDIKVLNLLKKNSFSKSLKFNKELFFNNIKILNLDDQNKLKFLNNIDLSKEKILNDFFSKYTLLNDRLKNIYSPSLNVPSFLKGNSPKIMGILNITENSFYDGGKYINIKKAINHAYKLIKDGADIIDIGGESTKPNSLPIPQKIELSRVLPLVKELTKNNIVVSCDTRNSLTMKTVLDHGVQIINDVSGLNFDKKTLNVIKKYQCYYILMHSVETPITMQKNPNYKNVATDLYGFFKNKINIINKKEIKLSKIIIDPGIGFGKTDIHNFEILKFLPIFLDLGLPILIGLSRKSFIGRFINTKIGDRLPCSISLAIDAFLKGASIIRVHDVKATKDAINIFKKVN